MNTPIVVTGAGMATSLGSLVMGCAAARAGIVRAVPVDLVVGSRDSELPQQVTGHACPPVEGFEGLGRLLHLASLALEDLLLHTNSLGSRQSRLPLLVALPPLEERPGLQQQLHWEDESRELSRSFIDGLHRLSSSSGIAWDIRVSQRGHAGFLGLLNDAMEMLRAGQAEACVVGGVDSYLDVGTQEWLYATGRLKHPNQPVGLMPGEGAAFVRVERVQSANRAGHVILASVGPVVVHTETYRLDDERPGLHGRALVEAIREVLQRNEQRERDVRVMIHDLNGQERRAREWGTALIQLLSDFRSLGELERWLPAVSFGDTGCAAGAIAACMAIRAFARGYSRGNEILLCNASEQGERGAAILRRYNG